MYYFGLVFRKLRIVTYMSPLGEVPPTATRYVSTLTHPEARWPLYYYEVELHQFLGIQQQQQQQQDPVAAATAGGDGDGDGAAVHDNDGGHDDGGNSSINRI